MKEYVKSIEIIDSNLKINYDSYKMAKVELASMVDKKIRLTTATRWTPRAAWRS